MAVIFLASYGSQDAASWALSLGAYYYFLKPPEYSLLKGILVRAVEYKRLRRELDILKRAQAWEDTCRRIFPDAGKSNELRRVMETSRDQEKSVLLCGEVGVGKKRLARALHHWLLGAEKPFVIFEGQSGWRSAVGSEGLDWRRFFNEADGGSLYLDGVEYLDPESQARLAHQLSAEKQSRRADGRSGFRLLASTSLDLNEAAAAGQFHPPLLSMIGRFRFSIPPLRERRSDIPLLAYAFLQEIAARERRDLLISPAAVRLLQDHPWPGNIRQFHAELERAAGQAGGGEIREEHLSIGQACRPAAVVPCTLKEIEASAILMALERSRGNKSRTAKMLGLSRKTLYKRLKELAPNSRVDSSLSESCRFDPRP